MKLTERERKANRLVDGWEYTLPTEAQWERACRARTETDFSFGNDASILDAHAWFHGNTWVELERYPHRVGQKEPNPWGFYDMHGNVWEWCRDWHSHKLPGGRDPEVTEKGASRVFRGGSWNHPAQNCRSAKRNGIAPAYKFYDLGFRVVLSAILDKPAVAADARGTAE